MHQPQTTEDIVEFYLKQSRMNTRGALERVCGPCGISLTPTKFSELVPIPVYEDGPPATLFSTANQRARTTISWPAVTDVNFLQAYVKKYRKDGRVWNDIVVNVSNYCWARFYATKELIHCVTNEDGYPASDSLELVNDLIESLISGGSLHMKPQTIVDQVAWLGACEYLAPTPWIPLIAQLHTNMSASFPDANSYLHIAQLLRVPELVLRYRLKNPGG